MRRQNLARRLLGKVRGLLGIGLLLTAGCGGSSDSLVVVRVGGLISSITELYVTMQLDGVPAKNSRPQTGSGDGAFVIYDDKQRFGVQVPAGTQQLGLNIIGYNTSLEVVRSGTATLDLLQGREFDVQLH